MRHAGERNQLHVGKDQEVLIEGASKRSEEHLFGRNTQNAVVILPRHNSGHPELRPGDRVTARTSAPPVGRYRAHWSASTIPRPR